VTFKTADSSHARPNPEGEAGDAAAHVAYRPAFSATVPDWSREHKRFFEWSPPCALLASLRDYQRWRQGNVVQRLLLSRWAVLRHRWWSAITGADIPLNAQIAGGLRITHPNGVVVHPRAVVGPNCLLFQQVTLGTGGRIPGAPRLMGHNAIGAGAKILGGVTIGPHAKVGANAVVLCDVPEGATAVGIPAKVIRPGAGRPADDLEEAVS